VAAPASGRLGSAASTPSAQRSGSADAAWPAAQPYASLISPTTHLRLFGIRQRPTCQPTKQFPNLCFVFFWNKKERERFVRKFFRFAHFSDIKMRKRAGVGAIQKKKADAEKFRAVFKRCTCAVLWIHYILVRIRIRIRIMLFSSVTFMMSTKNYFILNFSAYYFLKVHLHNFSMIKSQRSRKTEGIKVFLLFCLIIEDPDPGGP
jgi:hypothetical protein